jgi:hypothetical protein
VLHHNLEHLIWKRCQTRHNFGLDQDEWDVGAYNSRGSTTIQEVDTGVLNISPWLFPDVFNCAGSFEIDDCSIVLAVLKLQF